MALRKIGEYSSEEVEAYLFQLFTIADGNQNGILEPDEVEWMLMNSGFEFTPAQIEQALWHTPTRSPY